MLDKLHSDTSHRAVSSALLNQQHILNKMSSNRDTHKTSSAHSHRGGRDHVHRFTTAPMPHLLPVHSTLQTTASRGPVLGFQQYFNIFFSFWPCHAACRILVLQPEMEPTPPSLEAQSLNHWTVREVPPTVF